MFLLATKNDGAPSAESERRVGQSVKAGTAKEEARDQFDANKDNLQGKMMLLEKRGEVTDDDE